MELWYTEEWTDNVRFSIKVDNHLFSDKSEFQQVDVFESKEFGKFLTLDGLMMVTEKDEFIYHDMIVHGPMATNPNIKNVLVIGAGDGGTVRELTRYETIEKIDMVEIDKLVVDVCREYLPQTANKLDDPRVSLFFEDGLKFVRSVENKYDLIICDEWGYIPISLKGSELLFQVIADCYERKSLIITTNLEFGKWITIFMDKKLTSAIIDRIIHHSHLVVFSGDSYRIKNSTINSI